MVHSEQIFRAAQRISDAPAQMIQDRVERLHLVVQTLLALLIEKQIIGEDEFHEWIDYIDRLDGVRDGKLREDRSPQTCTRCGRNNAPHALQCAYCGSALERRRILPPTGPSGELSSRLNPEEESET